MRQFMRFTVVTIVVAMMAAVFPPPPAEAQTGCQPSGFTDVPAGLFFSDPVAWAACNGVTTGTSPTTFSPLTAVTRGQLATFVWRYDGEPTGFTHPFTDVNPSDFYEEAVAWMAATGLTTGTSATTFSPGSTVTRGQLATFLWRYDGEPTGFTHPFTDVSPTAYYEEAVAWMAATGITTGTTTTTFSPDDPLTRGQAVTFLYRYNNLVLGAAFSDDFSADSLSDWTLRHQAEGEPAQYTLLDVNQTHPGSLTIRPTLTPGWFENGTAPLIYKMVEGNFSVETSVTTESTSNPGAPPGNNFNSAGLMVRHTQAASQNYLMLNVGRQNGFTGSESKTTVNSSSILNLQPGSASGRLTLCRIDNVFFMYRRLDNEPSWTQIGSFTRNDMPATVQVGMIVNGYSGPDIIAEFDYITMHVPSTQSACTR